MLKYFYKMLLVSILSGSLLILDFGFKGSQININFNSARAESVKTNGIGDEDISSTLTMSIVGLIASRLYTYQPMTTDVTIAAVAGAAFIAGEIAAFAKLKDVMKDIETEVLRDDKKVIDRKQIEALEKLKESYQKAIESSNIKKTLQQASAAAFTTAAVAALVLKSSELLALQGCQAALTTAGATCTGTTAEATALVGQLTTIQTAREAPAASVSQKPTEVSGLSAFTLGLETYTTTLSLAAATSNPALSAACATAATSIQVCNAISPTLQTTEAFGFPFHLGLNQLQNTFPPAHYCEIPKGENVFTRLSHFFIPEAKADLLSPMGIASGVAVKFILATSPALSATIDSFLFTPMKRAMAWGILAGLSYSASSATDNQIHILNGNIAQIDMILNTMYAQENGTVAGGATKPTLKNPYIQSYSVINQPLKVIDPKSEIVDLNEKGDLSLPCLTGDGVKKCESISAKLDSQIDVKSMPDSIQATIGNIGKFGESLNKAGSITANTMTLAQAISGKQNALKEELAKQQKALQAQLKASGSKTDLAKESAKLAADMKAKMKKQLDSNKMSAREMLASFGGSRVGLYSEGSSVTDANRLEAASKNAAAAKAVLSKLDVLNIPAPLNPSAKSANDELDDELKNKEAEQLAMASAENAKAASIDTYDLKNDITTDKQTSLFELISNRYQKSAYKRLLKKKQD